MNIKGNITDSLQYPFDNWVKIIILGIILIIPIVNLIGLGYYIRIIKSTLVGFDELPDFGNLKELFIDGIKILIVLIIYAIVPLLFYGLSLVFAGPATVPSSITTSSVFSSYLPVLTGIPLVFLIIAAISTIIINVFMYMGIANMAYSDGEIRAALRYSEILDKITIIGWKNYIIWWIVLILITLFAELIIIIIGGILLYFVFGFLVILLGYGYLLMFHARSVALTFASSGEY